MKTLLDQLASTPYFGALAIAFGIGVTAWVATTVRAAIITFARREPGLKWYAVTCLTLSVAVFSMITVLVSSAIASR